MTRSETYAACRDAGRDAAKHWERNIPLENYLDECWEAVMWNLVDRGAVLDDAREGRQQFFVGAWQITGVQ